MARVHDSAVIKSPGDGPATPKDIFKKAQEIGAEIIDLKFCDMLGTWQHCAFPVDDWSEDTFVNGVGFDGSSIRGWQNIAQSDMLAIPQPDTAVIDPFFTHPTISIIADVLDPMTREEYAKDPRHVAKQAEAYLRSTEIADTCFIGPEPEFFIFDQVRYEQNQHIGLYEIDSVEGAWNTSRFEEPNLGYKPSYKGGYFPVSPTDTYGDMRTEMVLELKKIGIAVEAHHHEVGTGGQAEIDMQCAPLLKMGDQFMWYKYIVKNVAKRNGKTVTFMPKPIFQDNGSGMHTHISLWKEGKPLFAGNGYAGLSDLALWAIGGLLKHARAVIAFTNPTANSYHRLVPGFEAPVNLAMSMRNRSAGVRIPMYSDDPKAKRLEFRCPDPACNGYLAWSAALLATIDGVQNRVDPGKPLDRDIYAMSEEDLAEIPSTPDSLEEALDALDKDHEFLLKGNVFSEDLIQTWIDYKKQYEIGELRLRPHPYEFELYYDN